MENKTKVEAVNIQELLVNVLETKTRLAIGQISYAMADTVKNEFSVNPNNAEKLRSSIERAETLISMETYHTPQFTRGIFSEQVRNSVGFKAYALEKILSGDTTFDVKYFKEIGIEFDKTSIQSLIGKLQELL